MTRQQELREARQTKFCRACGENKPNSEFYLRAGAKDGLYNECKECLCARSSSKNRDRDGYKFSPIGFAQYLVSSARKRAGKQSIDFDIDIDFVLGKLKNGVCEVTNIPLNMTRGKRGPFSPTLDQIMPGGGYTKNNTQLVCWIYNSAKGNWSHEEVIFFAKAILNGK